MFKMAGAVLRIGWLPACLMFLLSRWPGITRESDSCRGPDCPIPHKSSLAYRKSCTRRDAYKKGFYELMIDTPVIFNRV